MTNVLYLDIETSPNVGDVWSLWNQNISLSQLRETTRMICFAWKWRDEKPVNFASEWADGREAMVKAAHAVLSQADVVAHFNGKKFDIRHINREIAEFGLTPPAPFVQLDLLNVVKRHFLFPSNKLQHVSERFGIGSKVAHEGHALWVKVLAGDPKARRDMERYAKQDVALLQPLHDKLMPWTYGVNMRLYVPGDDVCPSCGADALIKEGYAYTNLGRFQRFHCRDCGKWSRSTKRLDGTDITGVSS